jgi:hypothetical protein
MEICGGATIKQIAEGYQQSDISDQEAKERYQISEISDQEARTRAPRTG